MTKRSPKVAKPIVFAVGIVCDLLITGVDIPVTLVWSVPLVFSHGGPDASGCKDDVMLGVLTFPLWYPIQIIAVNVWPKDMYQDVFGVETGIYRDITKPADSNGRA